MHQIFIVTPINKANGKAAAVSERFYTFFIIKELGLRENHARTSETYETCMDRTNEELINSQCSTILRYFDISLIPENQYLSLIYWMPKQHTNTTKASLIIIVSKFCLKPLHKSVSSVFKLVIKKLRVITMKVFSFHVLNHSRRCFIINYLLTVLKE